MIKFFVNVHLIKYFKINCSQNIKNQSQNQEIENSQSSGISTNLAILNSMAPKSTNINYQDDSDEETIDTCTIKKTINHIKSQELNETLNKTEIEKKYVQDQLEITEDPTTIKSKELQDYIDKANKSVDHIMEKEFSTELIKEYLDKMSSLIDSKIDDNVQETQLIKDVKLNELIKDTKNNINSFYNDDYWSWEDLLTDPSEPDPENLEYNMIDLYNQTEDQKNLYLEISSTENQKWVEENIEPTYKKILSELINLPFLMDENKNFMDVLQQMYDVYHRGSESFPVKKIMNACKNFQDVDINMHRTLEMRIYCALILVDDLDKNLFTECRKYTKKRIDEMVNKNTINEIIKDPHCEKYKHNTIGIIHDIMDYYCEKLFQKVKKKLEIIAKVQKYKIHDHLTTEDKEKFSLFNYIDNNLNNRIFEHLIEKSPEKLKQEKNQKQQEIEKQNSLSKILIDEYIKEVPINDDYTDLLNYNYRPKEPELLTGVDQIKILVTAIIHMDECMENVINYVEAKKIPIKIKDLFKKYEKKQQDNMLYINNINKYEKIIEKAQSIFDYVNLAPINVIIKTENNKINAIVEKIIKKFKQFEDNMRSIIKKLNHYEDEVLKSLAIELYDCVNQYKQNFCHNFNINIKINNNNLISKPKYTCEYFNLDNITNTHIKTIVENLHIDNKPIRRIFVHFQNFQDNIQFIIEKLKQNQDETIKQIVIMINKRINQYKNDVFNIFNIVIDKNSIIKDEKRVCFDFKIPKKIDKIKSKIELNSIQSYDSIKDLFAYCSYLSHNTVFYYTKIFLQIMDIICSRKTKIGCYMKDILNHGKNKRKSTYIEKLNNRGQYTLAYHLIMLNKVAPDLLTYTSIEQDANHKIIKDPLNNKHLINFSKRSKRITEQLKKVIFLMLVHRSKYRKIQEMRQNGCSQQDINKFNEKFKSIEPLEPFIISQIIRYYITHTISFQWYCDNGLYDLLLNGLC